MAEPDRDSQESWHLIPTPVATLVEGNLHHLFISNLRSTSLERGALVSVVCLAPEAIVVS